MNAAEARAELVAELELEMARPVREWNQHRVADMDEIRQLVQLVARAVR